MPSSIHNYSIFTARKRSLGQGNIFIGVCQEFCSRGVVCFRGVSAPGWPCLLPGGMSAPRGCVSAPGGCLFRGGLPGGDPLPPRRILLRAVRILLECIFVFLIIMKDEWPKVFKLVKTNSALGFCQKIFDKIQGIVF